MEPLEKYNQQLLAEVHPSAWINPEPSGRYNLVVIGGGTAGSVAASFTGPETVGVDGN